MKMTKMMLMNGYDDDEYGEVRMHLTVNQLFEFVYEPNLLLMIEQEIEPVR